MNMFIINYLTVIFNNFGILLLIIRIRKNTHGVLFLYFTSYKLDLVDGTFTQYEGIIGFLYFLVVVIPV